MLQSIVNFSLRFRGVVIALACALLGYGIYSLTSARYDVFPEFAPAQVVIHTEAPGLAPEQIEVLITQPIENAITGVPDVGSVRSRTIQGLSVITVVFRSGGDIYRDRQVVAERLSSIVGQLPTGTSPILAPLTSSTSIVLAVGLTSNNHSLMDLTTIAKWTVRSRLLAVPGVAKVAIFGAETKQIQIQFNPDKLVDYGLGTNDLIAAARKATGIRGAGLVDTANQRIVLQSKGQSVTPEQIARTVVTHRNGANLTLGDVARVVDAPAPRVGGASVMGKPALILMISSQYGANTLEVTGGLEQAIAELRPALLQQGITIEADIFRPANFIDTTLGNVRNSLLIGAVLVMAVLFLALRNVRTAAISCTAIPLSLLAAVIVIERLGFSLNTMTLGGLAIAIGEVVDDAVIDVENIYRRLRENRALPEPQPALQVVYRASLEVRSAVVYATFAVVLVFVPVLTMSGLAGRLFAPLGIAYISAILASLAVALTVTPALSLVFLGRRDLPPQDPPLVAWTKIRYRRLLLKIEQHPGAVLLGAASLVVLGLALLPFLRTSFLPELQEGHLIVHMKAMPGTSIAEMLRIGERVTQTLTKLPEISRVAQTVGRAELSDDNAGTYASEFNVDLKPVDSNQTDSTKSRILAALKDFSGVQFSANTFLTERIHETLSGYTGSVVVNVFGNSLDQLDKDAGRIAGLLRGIPGATGVQIQSPPGMPQVVVQLRPEALARWGFDSVDALDAVRTAYQGDTIGQIYQGNQVFDLTVILAADRRDSIAEIGSLPLRSPDGTYVPLRRLADIYETSGRYIVLHEGARRVQAITCNVTGGNAAGFVTEAKRRLAKLSLSPGNYFEFGGTAAAQAKSQRELLIHSALAGLGIVLLLSIVLGNRRNLLLVLSNLPFALVGGVMAVMLTGGQFSLGSMVGFVTVFGITLRNSIMLVTHYQHLVATEGLSWGLETAVRGAAERLAPILMTASVTGLGLLPLAIGSGTAGREIEGPMAIVILGGLISSTVLNLLVLPTIALRYGRFDPRALSNNRSASQVVAN